MSYRSHFRMLDDIVHHLDQQAADKKIDAFLKSRYTGFFAVSAAAAIEVALKDIVINFAEDTHSMFGEYVVARYDRINGRIGLAHLRDEHISPFGSGYAKRFDNEVEKVERYANRRWRTSVKSHYKLMLNCRHLFAHEGQVPASTTYEEIKKGYVAGKVILACVAQSLK